MEIRDRLFEFKDEEYKKFSSSLIPNISPDRVIGIRTPVLRKLVREISTEDAEFFLKELPHQFFEENNLHCFLIEKIADFDKCAMETERILPFIDNWATTDSFNPKALSKNPDRLLELALKWIDSGNTFTIRFGILTLMRYFLGERFETRFLSIAASIRSEEYYVNMMVAWYFSVALVKQWDSTIPFLEEKRLSAWVHNKTISKALDSFRITPEQKNYLKTLKMRNVENLSKK